MMQPIVEQKGICVFNTKVFGSEGHSSSIKQEVSAIHEAVKLISWLEQKMDALIADNHIDNRFTPPHSTIHIGKGHLMLLLTNVFLIGTRVSFRKTVFPLLKKIFWLIAKNVNKYAGK